MQQPNNPQFNRGGQPPGLPPPHAYPGDGPRHGPPPYLPAYPPHAAGPHNIHPVSFRGGAPPAMPGPIPFNAMNRNNAPYNGYRPPQPPPHHFNKGHHGHPGPRNDRWEPRGGHHNNNQSRPPPLPLPSHLPPRPLAPLGTSGNDRGHRSGHNKRPEPPGGGEIPDKSAGAPLNYG